MITSEKTKAGFAMGRCGDNLAWMLDDGVLTITGEGKMECSEQIPWSEFRNIITSVVIEGGVTDIGYHALSYCVNLTNVVISQSVTAIDWFAFFHCLGLNDIVIPDNIVSIGVAAFWGCTGMTSVTIPDSVICIGSQAFYNCTGLTDVYYAGSKADWGKIIIGAGNDSLVNATIHFGR